MKRGAVQEDTIGTAAIDLFASGMGAFILIALVFMVLFAATPTQTVAPTTPETAPAAPAAGALACPIPEPCPQAAVCPDCPPPVVCPAIPEPLQCPAPPPVPAEIPECPAPAPQVCPAQQACPVCEICPATAEPVLASAPPPEIPEAPVCPELNATTLLPDLDLVFVIDSTGSMYNEIESLKRDLYFLVEVLERIMPTVGIGVVTFNDRRQNPAVRHHPLRQLTGDEAALIDIQRFLRGITAGEGRGGNPDIPEAVLSALQAAVSTSFREGVTNRSIVVITDAWAYDDEAPQSFSLAGQFASVEGQRISAVHIREDRTSQRYLEQLVEAGGGAFVADRGSLLANVLLTIL